jgi:hypothetical protein
MKTKVNNCGNYNCAHCSSDGRCMVSSISIDQDGKCIAFRLSAYSRETVDPMYEHTNMC